MRRSELYTLSNMALALPVLLLHMSEVLLAHSLGELLFSTSITRIRANDQVSRGYYNGKVGKILTVRLARRNDGISEPEHTVSHQLYLDSKVPLEADMNGIALSLHLQHVPLPVLDGPIRPWCHLPHPLDGTGHQPSCYCDQRGSLRWCSLDVCHLKLPRAFWVNGHHLRFDQEHLVVRNQLRYHPLVGIEQLSHRLLYHGGHWVRVERKLVCHDQIWTETERKDLGEILERC